MVGYFLFLSSMKMLLIHKRVFYFKLLICEVNKLNGLEINAYWTLKVFKVIETLYVDFVIVSKNSAITFSND